MTARACMRGALLAALAAFVLLESCAAATLRVRGTAPNQLNDGTCTAPVLLPASSTLEVHVQVIGRALEDSVAVVPGSAFALSWTVPAGTYQVRAWASIASAPAFVGCDTTITAIAQAPPWRIAVSP